MVILGFGRDVFALIIFESKQVKTIGAYYFGGNF